MEGTDSLKAKVSQRSNAYVKYKVEAFYQDTGVAQSYARSSARRVAASIVIVLLLIWMSFEKDFNDAATFKNADIQFQLIFWLFSVFFTVDLTLRFLAFKRRVNAMSDSRFVSESLLTGLLLLHGIISYAISESSTWFRTLWYVQMLRLFLLAQGEIPELAIILKGLLLASRSVFFTLCLFMMVLYMFAIVFCSEAAGSTLADTYFPDIPETMHTLLLHGSLMSGYAEFAKALQESGLKGLEALLFVFTFISVVLFAVMLGITCQVLYTVSLTEKDRLVAEYMRSHINSEIGRAKADDDSTISRNEFSELLQRPSMGQLVNALSIDVFSVIDALDAIFRNEDSILVADLVEAIMQFSTEGPVSKKDLLLFKAILAAKGGDIPTQFKAPADSPRDAEAGVSSKKIQKVVQESLSVSIQALQAAMNKKECVDFTQIDVRDLTKAIEKMSLPGQL